MGKNYILFIFLILNIFQFSIEQKKNKLIEKVKEKEENKETDVETPLIETRIYKDKEGNHIRYTRIQYGKSKNLGGNSDFDNFTPFQIMKVLDNRVNNIFEDIIRQSMGIKLLLNGFSINDDILDPFKDDDDDDDDEDDEDDEDEEKENGYKKNSKDENKISINDVEDKDDIKEKVDEAKSKERVENNKNNKNIMNIDSKKEDKIEKKVLEKDGKNKLNNNGVRSKIKKKRLNKRELIFSRVCKYIFYTIVLFTSYILIKKLLEFLGIIDSANDAEIKMENDEEFKLQKVEEKKS